MGAPKLKDYFTNDVIRQIGALIQSALASFDIAHFIDATLRPTDAAPFTELEFIARSKRLADAIEQTSKLGSADLLDVVVRALPAELEGAEGTLSERFYLWPFGELVGRHGVDDPDRGLNACYELTKRFTAEFAIRPILATHPGSLATLAAWTSDPNEHVRRLVSEGTRPRLPWAQRLDLPIDDTLPLLSDLRADDSPYVRKSVANHLNDVSKSHPDRVIADLAEWHAEGTSHTRWIVRHALRTHLKQGTPGALDIFGYRPPHIEVSRLGTAPATVAIGETVDISFEISSTSRSPQLLMIDLVMGYVKSTGSRSPKVFKFVERTLQPEETLSLSKTFPMVARSTRALYPGEHSIAVRVNGVDVAETTFHLDR